MKNLSRISHHFAPKAQIIRNNIIKIVFNHLLTTRKNIKKMDHSTKVEKHYNQSLSEKYAKNKYIQISSRYH